jgi:hypothetical protein
MTDYERGYEKGKADAENGIETYREGILVGPCFCRKWPGGVPPLRHWVGLTEDELVKIWTGTPAESEYWFEFAQAIEAKLREKNGG